MCDHCMGLSFRMKATFGGCAFTIAHAASRGRRLCDLHIWPSMHVHGDFTVELRCAWSSLQMSLPEGQIVHDQWGAQVTSKCENGK